VNEFVFGLAPYRILRPEIPASHHFLFREEWGGEAGCDRLVELLTDDQHLFAAINWLARDPSREVQTASTGRTAAELVDLLGVESAREAAVGLVLFRAFRMGRSPKFNYDEFWTRALARGLAARRIASMLQGSPVPAFLSSFFSEFGQVVLAASNPEGYGGLLRGENDEALIARERGLFGIDRNTAGWVVLRDAGISRAVFGPLLAKSRDIRSNGQPPVKLASWAQKNFNVGNLLGDIIVANGPERADIWREFVALRKELELGRDVLNALGDLIVNDWWDWGDLLSVPTRTLPGFSELSDWNERNIEPVRFNPTGGRPLIARTNEHGLDILFVEDNAVVREGTKRLLERAGHQIRTAGDGREALEILRQSPPQVVLSDWHMPNMDGLELCAHLRRTELGKRTFFILFTGEDDEDRIVTAYQAGINDFIAKRSPSAILLARITAAHNFLAQWKQVDEDRRIIRAHCEHSRRQAARMKEDSLTDALTGLPNRRFAMDRLRDEWARSERAGQTMSVVMIDIDHFKRVNDDHGHDVGDFVLQEVAEIFRSVTRRNEAACRIGGEEFLIICSDADLAAAASCGERVRSAIEAHHISFADFDRNVTISVGVAQRQESLADTNELFKAADEAIYQAKETGRNRVVLWPSLKRALFVGDRLAG